MPGEAHSSNPPANREVDVEFTLLGTFEMRAGGRNVPVGSPKHRALLAALVLQAGRQVTMEELGEAIWGDEQPSKPRRAVQLYVTRLRKMLDSLGAGRIVTTYADGYCIDIGPGRTDHRRAVPSPAIVARVVPSRP